MNPASYDVKFLVDNRKVKNVSPDLLQAYSVNCETDADLIKQIESGRESTVLFDSEREESNWVRRSSRSFGKDQFDRVRVNELIESLNTDSPGFEVLRLKNYIYADTNKRVLEEVLHAIRSNTSVQALYIQNMEEAMDDEMLELLTVTLQKNLKIWCLNVGENFKVTRKGWEKFTQGLQLTHVTHMYAGSETTVTGELKVRMRSVIRSNRAKHSLHNDPNNFNVIKQIGQMWWNPRNAKVFQKQVKQEILLEAEMMYRPMIGHLVSVFFEAEGYWLYGRITNFRERDHSHNVTWIVDDIDEFGEQSSWMKLRQYDFFISAQVVWACEEDNGTLIDNNSKQKKRSSSMEQSFRNSKKSKIAQFNQHKCTTALDELSRLPASMQFRVPFKWKKFQCWDYLEKIKEPMDLKTIRKKLWEHKYSTNEQFRIDVCLVFQNFLDYFASKSVDFSPFPLKKWAAELLVTFKEEFVETKQTSVVENSNSKMKPAILFRHSSYIATRFEREAVTAPHCYLHFLSDPVGYYHRVDDVIPKKLQSTDPDINGLPLDMIHQIKKELLVFSNNPNTFDL